MRARTASGDVKPYHPGPPPAAMITFSTRLSSGIFASPNAPGIQHQPTPDFPSFDRHRARFRQEAERAERRRSYTCGNHLRSHGRFPTSQIAASLQVAPRLDPPLICVPLVELEPLPAGLLPRWTADSDCARHSPDVLFGRSVLDWDGCLPPAHAPSMRKRQESSGTQMTSRSKYRGWH